MRVLVTGSHGTGKTSLVHVCCAALESAHPGQVGVIEETARKVIKLGLPMARDATLDSYIVYICTQLAAERQAEQTYVLSDRGVMDILAYLMANANADIPRHFADMVMELALLEKKYFDLYCYLPIEFPAAYDSVRPSDEAYRMEVDRQIASALSQIQAPTVIIGGTLEGRRDKLLALISRSERRKSQ